MSVVEAPAEELVRAEQLRVGDTLLMALGEYPVRAIERTLGTVRVRFARRGIGLLEEDFGSMTFVPTHEVRRKLR